MTDFVPSSAALVDGSPVASVTPAEGEAAQGEPARGRFLLYARAPNHVAIERESG